MDNKALEWHIARIPQTLSPYLVAAFVPPDTPADAAIELVIIVEGENIPTREFAMYLALIDRLYGRLSTEGLQSYAHRELGHLKIAEIHKSQLEVIFRALYDHSDVVSLIMIMMFLKGLPKMFRLTTEGVKYLAEAYKSFEEGKLIRDRRVDVRHLRQQRESFKERRAYKMLNKEEGRLVRPTNQSVTQIVEQEPALEKLPDLEKHRLGALFDALVVEENSNLPAAMRFAHRQVKGVILRIRKPKSE